MNKIKDVVERDIKLHIDGTEANVRKVPQVLWLSV